MSPIKSVAILLLFGLSYWPGTPVYAEGPMKLQLVSEVIQDGEGIPARFTCQGDDISPALSWTGVPAGTRSLVLIVDDPDAPDPRAPRMTWVHWLLYDLPPDPARRRAA